MTVQLPLTPIGQLLFTPQYPIPMPATLKPFLVSTFGVLAFESPDSCSFLDVFVSIAVAICQKCLSVFVLWVS